MELETKELRTVPKTKGIYALLTEAKFHAYSSHSRCWKIHIRAMRMGVKHEWLSANVKSGDPYKRVKLTSYETRWGGPKEECGQDD